MSEVNPQLWRNEVDPRTGEQSLKTHELKTVKQWCGNHTFTQDIPRNRIIKCVDCGQEVRFVLGLHKLDVHGHLVSQSS